MFPYSKKQIRELERIQRTMIKMMPSFKGMTFKVRLREKKKRKRTSDSNVQGREAIDRDDLFVWDIRNGRGLLNKWK